MILCGTLWVAADEDELAAARQKQATLRAYGVRAELLDARQVVEAEPQLRAWRSAGGLVQSDDQVVYPPCVARWLIEQACAKGRDRAARYACRIARPRLRLPGRRHASCGGPRRQCRRTRRPAAHAGDAYPPAKVTW